MKRLLTNKEMRDMIQYYAMCQSLRDFIDDRVAPSNFHFQKIKQYSNLLVKELEAQVDVLMKADANKEQGAVLEQFVNATAQADYLFDVALQLEGIDQDKKIECATKVSDILKEYGIK